MDPLSRAVIVTALVSATAAATAHTGHDTHGLAAGLVHPLAIDHLLAMVAVGLWSARGSSLLQRLAGPLVFMLALLAGAMAGALGLLPAPSDAGIAASVMLFGALLALPYALPRTTALAAIAAAALLHGLAHGVEAPAAGGFAAYAAGLMAATAVLHALGLLAGRHLVALQRGLQAALWRLLGTGVGLAGAALLAAA